MSEKKEKIRKAKMKSIAKILVGLVGSWVTIQIFAYILIPNICPGFAGLGIVIFPLIGIGIILVSLISLFVYKERRYVSIFTAIFVAVFIYSSFSLGVKTPALIHFHLYRFFYEKKVETVIEKLKVSENDKSTIDEDYYYVLSRKPVRVSFHYLHTYMNWYDIVYDSSDEVSSNDYEVKKHIDMYFVDSQHIYGHWYLCHFSD